MSLNEPFMTEQMTLKPVLDACCGSRMFWFDKKNPQALFVDKRREDHILKDKTAKSGFQSCSIQPDMVADFKALPFADSTFSLIVFDPPHLIKHGSTGWLVKKYGKLPPDWENELRLGFAECIRVLRSLGTLVFKWSERDIPVSKVISLAPMKPLFGNRCGKGMLTHWMVFLKPETPIEHQRVSN